MRGVVTGIAACLLMAAGFAAGGGLAADRADGLPDPAKVYQIRANCHNSYDLLFVEVDKGTRPAEAEAQWALAYETAREAGQPCPEPPQTLLSRANGHVISSEQSMGGVTRYAINQKDPVAMFEAGLAMFNGKFGQEMVQDGYGLISQAADLGDPEALYNKGMMFARGQIDNKVDYEAGIPLVEAAAKSGHVDAMFAAGSFAMGGQARRKDPKAAFEWFRMAAERGHFYATFMAWDMLTKGEGVRKDFDLAYRLSRRVAQDGQVYGAVMAASALLQTRDPMSHQDEILYWMDYAISHGDQSIRDQVVPMRQQVVDVITRPEAPAGYQPRPYKACPMKTVCIVNHYSGLQRCTTNKDYWNDCDW